MIVVCEPEDAMKWYDIMWKNTVELLTEKNNLLQAQQEQLQAKYMAILNTQLLKFYQGDKLAL